MDNEQMADLREHLLYLLCGGGRWAGGWLPAW